MPAIREFISFVEAYPVTGAFLLALAAAGIIGIAKVTWTGLHSRRNRIYVDPVLWSLPGRFWITVVHQYLPSDHPSGYEQTQYSRPDQWKKLVTVRSSFFGLRHRIVPHDPNAALVVAVRRKGRREQHIHFNRYV